MSHNVQIKGMKINDLDALDKAIAELKREGIDISLDRGTPGMREKIFRTYKYVAGNDPHADHVIRIPGAPYDIGLIQQPAGHYEPVFDDALGIDLHAPCPIACAYKPGEARNMGHGIGKLMQHYTAIVTEKAARLKGYMPRRVTTKDGSLQVIITT